MTNYKAQITNQDPGGFFVIARLTKPAEAISVRQWD